MLATASRTADDNTTTSGTATTTAAGWALLMSTTRVHALSHSAILLQARATFKVLHAGNTQPCNVMGRMHCGAAPTFVPPTYALRFRELPA